MLSKVARSAATAAPVVLLVATWLAMAELLQGLQDGYAKPAFIVYVTHSGYVLALLPWAALAWHRHASGRPAPASARRLVYAAAPLTVGAFAIALAWYVSLPLTTVASNTAIYTSASAFIVAFSVPLLGASVTVAKLAAVALSITGVVLVAFGGSGNSGRDTPAGFGWVVGSTAGYALYETVFAWVIAPPSASEGGDGSDGDVSGGDRGVVNDGGGGGSGDTDGPITAPLLNVEKTASSNGADGSTPAASSLADKAECAALVLGAMGVWTLVLLWPVLLIANATGLEPFEAPPPPKARLLAYNVVLDSVNNLALLWGIATTSPLTMSVASTLVVPVGVVVDLLLHGTLPSALAAGGAVLIVSSVFVLHAPHAWWAPHAWCVA